MKKKSIIDGFIQKMRSNRKLELTVYMSIIVLALIIFVSTGGISCGMNADKANDSVSETTSKAPNEKELEVRLSEILTKINGAGRVKVMITYDNTTEIVTAEDQNRTNGDGGSSEEVSPATVSYGGNEEPIILTELMPRIRGVIVVADGATNIKVKVDLQTAVQTVLGVSLDRISVFAMNP